jgi:dTDP-4-dehydrorhamnose reductase
VYHVTNQGAVSWFEFVRDIVTQAGHDPAMVAPISTADLRPARPAPRPANSVLDNLALRSSGVPLLRHYRAPLAELVAVLTG